MPSIHHQGRRQSALETLGLRKKTDIEIVLEGREDFIYSYSTYDEIKGTVNLKFDKDTTIDDLSVTFEGVSATYVEKVATTAPTTGRTTGRHTFLKLLHPIDPEALPEHRIAKAGQTYQIPFTFVVPDRLLPQICTHAIVSDDVRHAHLQLPPSMGDPTLTGDGQSFVDDFAPDMSKVTYSVRAQVAKRNPTGRKVDVGDKSIKVRIIPAREEAPPLQIPEDSRDYILRKERNVKKGLFKFGKTGRLTAETTQPRSLQIPHPSKHSIEPVTTMTTVNLRFDPQTADDQPPQLGSIVAKLRVYTFFGAAPYKSIPIVSAQDNWSTLHGLYPEYLELSSRCLSTVPWTRHDPKSTDSDINNNDINNNDISRRPSTFSTISTGSSIPEPSASYIPGEPYYSASVLVPISLPTSTKPKKIFLPTFSSCIISRTYSLDLNISFVPPGTKVGSPSIVLKVPIQVSAEGGTQGVEESEAQIAREIERQFFNYEMQQLQESSRTDGQGAVGVSVLPPSPEYSERPDYSSLGQAARHGSYAPIAAPPEYHSGTGIGGRQVRSGGNARTQNVSLRVLG
jgi:hypothetical protein